MKYILLILTLFLTGCVHRQQISPTATATPTVLPNDTNATVYRALTISHELIEKTKIELSTSATYSTPAARKVSDALAYLIDSHDHVQKVYMAYYKASLSGGNARAEYNALAIALHDLDTKTATLIAARKEGSQ